MKRRIVLKNSTQEIVLEEPRSVIKTRDDFCIWYLQQDFNVKAKIRRNAHEFGFSGGSRFAIIPTKDMEFLGKGKPYFVSDNTDIINRLKYDRSDFFAVFRDKIVLLNNLRPDSKLVKLCKRLLKHAVEFTTGNKKQNRPFVVRTLAARILGVSKKTFERRLYKRPHSYAERFLEKQINNRVFIYDGNLVCDEALRGLPIDWSK